MNPIQKTWLKTSRPLMEAFNNKLGSRGGMIGRFGRFFAFGVRNYGVHPTARLAKWLNEQYLQLFAFHFRNYPLWKTFTQNNAYTVRITFLLSAFMRTVLLVAPLAPFLMVKPRQYTLKELNDRFMMLKLPFNTLKHRKSAHYVEINKRYSFLMGEEFQKKYQEIAEERKLLKRIERLTKYARPGYKYEEPANLDGY